jgi:broad specificity phosphatase PhoE
MPTLLLVRHAQASYGAADYDVLSDRAAAQIAALRAGLDARGITAPARVVSGPLRRQRDTAAGAFPDAAVTIDAGWDEYAADAVLTAHSASAARLESGGEGEVPADSRDFQRVLDGALAAWLADPDGATGADAWPRFHGAATGALHALADGLRSGETAVAFSSAGTIAAVTAALIGDPVATFVALNRVQVNTGITKVISGRSGLSLVSFNDHTHLDVADPALVTYR